MEQYIILTFDLIGTAIFAVTGALRAVHLKLDLLGVVVFACTVGVGGGMMR
ncbi:MAG: TRIC cation channel family protein, partial [Lentisphaeria bacterium]|nr:TRIC cation channel family protein [Lentisphaeria bacterium]